MDHLSDSDSDYSDEDQGLYHQYQKDDDDFEREDIRERRDLSNHARIKSQAIKGLKKQLKRLAKIPNVTFLCAVDLEHRIRKRPPFLTSCGRLRAAFQESAALTETLNVTATSTSTNKRVSWIDTKPQMETSDLPSPAKLPVAVGAAEILRAKTRLTTNLPTNDSHAQKEKLRMVEVSGGSAFMRQGKALIIYVCIILHAVFPAVPVSWCAQAGKHF